MDKPAYCTQMDGNCPMCALSSYGMDCQGRNIAAVALGRRGGAAKTDAKRAASVVNGAAPVKPGSKPRGRPKSKPE
ncbi:MAG: hypothetical protein WC815_23890 [Vicinamibacterales bacterium]